MNSSRTTDSSVFSFGTDSIASSYDDVLVPLLFEPWANRLLEEHSDWLGQNVLDLATGTGVVARLLADRVGPDGHIIGTDLNPEMLARARQRCTDSVPAIKFVESPAYPLAVASQSIDVVLCQQGVQFFPDRKAATEEIHRVLKPGGLVLVTTWCPAAECDFFGWICEVLAEIREPEIESIMRVPFDYMPPTELTSLFTNAGFADVTVERQTAPLHIPGGASEVISAAYASPIGPKLRNLSDLKREGFHAGMRQRADTASAGGKTMGELATHMLRASRPC